MNLIQKQLNKRSFHLKNRIFAVIMALLLLLPLCYATSFTGLGYSALLSAKENVCPGYSYILRVSLDESALGFEGYLSFDSALLSLNKVVPANQDLQNEFHVYSETGLISISHHEPVRKMLNITFTVDPKAKVGTETVVRFTSCKVITADGTKSIGDVSFTFAVVEDRSSDASLADLSVALYSSSEELKEDQKGVSAILQPGYSSLQKAYKADVPYEYGYFRINPVVSDEKATVLGALEGQLEPGVSKAINIKVVAEDGTESVYTVELLRAEEPDVPESPSQDPSQDVTSKDQPSESVSDDEEISSDLSVEESDLDSESTFESIDSVSSTGSPAFSSTTSIESFEYRNENWMGIILCIAAVGGLALIILLIRICVLFRKKQK